MNYVSCDYCTAPAKGRDEDGFYTCGDETTCMPVDRPFPIVVEVSSEDATDEEE